MSGTLCLRLTLGTEVSLVRVNGPHNVGDPHNAGLGK